MKNSSFTFGWIFSVAHLLTLRSPALGTQISEVSEVWFCTTGKPTHFFGH